DAGLRRPGVGRGGAAGCATGRASGKDRSDGKNRGDGRGRGGEGEADGGRAHTQLPMIAKRIGRAAWRARRRNKGRRAVSRAKPRRRGGRLRERAFLLYAPKRPPAP